MKGYYNIIAGDNMPAYRMRSRFIAAISKNCKGINLQMLCCRRCAKRTLRSLSLMFELFPELTIEIQFGWGEDPQDVIVKTKEDVEKFL